MENERLMTVSEFNGQVNEWALQVVRAARQTLQSETHGSGQLANWLSKYVDRKKDGDAVYKVKFQFDRYGVFRAYGAGRGYVVMNGQIVRGFRVRSDREIKRRQWNQLAAEEFKKGATVREINTMKVYRGSDGQSILRSRLDWIDVHVRSRIDQLADLCQEFYGDKAAEQILKYLGNVTIVKKP